MTLDPDDPPPERIVFTENAGVSRSVSTATHPGVRGGIVHTVGVGLAQRLVDEVVRLTCSGSPG